MNLNSFSPEVLEKIFIHLDSSSLSTCRQVCRKWRAICAETNPLLTPRVLSRVLQQLDTQSLLRARMVCKLWKFGLDMLTSSNLVLLEAQSCIYAERNEEIIRSAFFGNPFPSRIVGLTLVVRKRETTASISKMITSAIEVIRVYGSLIKYLNIKIILYSGESSILVEIVRAVARMLFHLTELQGFSIDISTVLTVNVSRTRPVCTCSVADNKRESATTAVESVEKDISVPQLNKLKAFRLVAWNFASEITDWLHYEILQNAPNLQFFDPDYYKCYSKFFTIFSHPDKWSFQLTSLKLAITEGVVQDVFKLISGAGFPLAALYLDIFEMSWEQSSKACFKIIQSALKSCDPTLHTLALGFYLESKFIPSPSLDVSRLLQGRISPEKTVSCSSLKRSKINAFKLRNLKLFGFRGSLSFLKDLKNLRKLVLIDFDPANQDLLNSEATFYHNIPTLRALYTPQFGTLDLNHPEAKLMDREYIPVYYKLKPLQVYKNGNLHVHP